MLPIGSIVFWPSASSPPSGWQVCDGTNGTPDLTDRTVPCAGGFYDPGDTGGSFSLNIPAHSHGLGTIEATMADDEGNHGHTWTYTTSTDSTAAGPYPSIPSGFGTPVGHSHTGTLDTISAFPALEFPNLHNHPISGSSTSVAAPGIDNQTSRRGIYFIQRLS